MVLAVQNKLHRDSSINDQILSIINHFNASDRANLYQKINNLPAACADWQKAFELGTEEAKLKLDSFSTKTR